MKEALRTYKLGLEKDKQNEELLNDLSQLEASLKDQELSKDPFNKDIINAPNFKNIIEFAKKEPENFLQMIQTETGIVFKKMIGNKQKSSEKSNSDDKLKNKELFLNDLQIEKEANIKGQSKPMTKRNIDELFEKESFLCQIQFQVREEGKLLNGNGTGFFCNINDENIPFNKALFTNNHILKRDSIKVGKYIQIKHIHISKEIQINENRRVFTDESLDYTCIELFESDGIKNCFRIDTELLNKKDDLIDKEIFILQYPIKDGDLFFSSGRIIKQKGYYLLHCASTEDGSSGSPLIERENNNVILGLQRGNLEEETQKNVKDTENSNDTEKIKFVKFNVATSFDEILKNIKLQLNRTILAIIEIKEDNLKSRIINSFENFVREKKNKDIQPKGKENEKQIKNSDIYINGKQIDWNYYYIFPKKGKYKIQYIFHDLLESTSYLFADCENLIEIDLSYFNTDNVTEMNSMFFGCQSLININLSNFKTENTTNMEFMFIECSALKSLDLSSFNTEKVVDMAGMFHSCKSLTEFDLSNFITKNVNKIDTMFMFCSNLRYLNLKNFTTEKVEPTLFIGIFLQCLSLTKENLITNDPLLVNNFTQNKLVENYYKFFKMNIKK